MTLEIWIVFGILAATIVLFVSDRLRLDITALLALMALTLTGILTPSEAAAGFGDTTVLLIAALFVVSDALLQTGIAEAMGRWLGRVAGTNERRILVTMMLVVAPISAFVSSTGAVAIMLPVVVAVANRARISPSRLLLPLAYTALIGGMLTLIGTPPNIIASEARAGAGRGAFGFFSFTPIGALVLGAAIIFLTSIGQRLLPDRVEPAARASVSTDQLSFEELAAAYRVQGTLTRLRVRPDSPLIGQTIAESGLADKYQTTVLAVHTWPPGAALPGLPRPVNAATRFEAGDLLDVRMPVDQALQLVTAYGLDRASLDNGLPAHRDLVYLEVALTPRSRFIGQTIVEADVRNRFGVSVLGMQRLGQVIDGDFTSEPLRFGDTLLVAGPAATLAPMVREQRYYGDFVVATVPAELEEQAGAPLSPRWPLALAIVVAMLVVMITNVLPTMIAALLAALALALTGCVRLNTVYTRMSWESLVLITAMLPMATALTKTGGAALIATVLVDSVGASGPLALLAGIFLLTSVLSQFISNTATAVLVMPIALQAGVGLEIAPEPLLMTAAIAASTAFATPVASPVNTLVLAPGGYRFADYARVGVPLQVLALLVCIAVVPLLFPF
ncbi:MAG: SLC13 family permease [Chloroflexaceae bacterium]